MLRLAAIRFFLLVPPSLASVLPRNNNVHDLDWKPCDLGFPKSRQEQIKEAIDCATIKVPLDYTNPESGGEVNLQLIKVNATKKPAKASVIFNPGGPGSPGVEEVAVLGPMYRDILGGSFNIIGFDARGTGRTIPFSCAVGEKTSGSDSGSLSRRNPYSQLPNPQVNVYNILKDQSWHGAREYFKSCYKSHKDTGRFYGTTFVARDLLAIVDALKEDGLLRFWGRSYSTILGQTFAAMFPQRVGRLLLDSVVEPDGYYHGVWASATRDTEFALFHFFEQCIEAGVEICPLANFTGTDTTADSLMSQLSDVLQKLKDDPVMVPKELQVPQIFWFTPGKWDLSLYIKSVIQANLYSPAKFLRLTSILGPVLAGNFSGLIGPEAIELQAQAAKEAPAKQKEDGLPWNLGIDAFHAIACSDSKFRAKKPEDMYSILQTQASQGSFADSISGKFWPCAQWPFTAAETYDGGFDQINTKNPILLVNGKWDPVTPLSGAWDVSSRFNGSRLLVHEGAGHGFQKSASKCTNEVVQKYFEKGEFPKLGMVCKADKNAFKQAISDADAKFFREMPDEE
ncbi:Tripeptidyl aminopeptidase [Fusarium oxysporum f. sp. rapae]|uniref:Tripeptidyl aminopeptidase n=1 Tax=Fusarium oxysporum f. sp. rapae TaxID=485398 RepID=A0A8J5TPK5_FUSOX|nr:Tripeptidyl aminopeptidase [Fusarium oxysporum f. sp. rapae]